MAELVTLSAADSQRLPPACACCLAPLDKPTAPQCEACGKHGRRRAVRMAAWIVLAAAGVAALFFFAPPWNRLSEAGRAAIPAAVLAIGVGTGALSRLVVPRTRHVVEGRALEVFAASGDSVTLRVANPRYADLIAAKAVGALRRPESRNPVPLILGVPFGGIWAELGLPVMATVHAVGVVLVAAAFVAVAWPRPGDERALAALRRAPTIPGVQAFLKEYPESPLGGEAAQLAWSCVATSRDRLLLRSYLSIPIAPNRGEVQARLAEIELADLDARPDWTRMARFASENPGHARSAEFRTKLAEAMQPAESEETPPVELFRKVLRKERDGALRVTVAGFANNGEHLATARQFVAERLKVHGVAATFVDHGEPAEIVLVGATSTVTYRGREGGRAEGLRYTLQIEVKAGGGTGWTGEVHGDPPESIYVRKGEEDSAGSGAQAAAYQALMQKLWGGALFTYPRAEAK